MRKSVYDDSGLVCLLFLKIKKAIQFFYFFSKNNDKILVEAFEIYIQII